MMISSLIILMSMENKSNTRFLSFREAQKTRFMLQFAEVGATIEGIITSDSEMPIEGNWTNAICNNAGWNTSLL